MFGIGHKGANRAFKAFLVPFQHSKFSCGHLEHDIKHFGTFGSFKMWKIYVLCLWEQIYCAHEHITSLGEQWEQWSRNTWMSTAHMGTSTWEHRNLCTINWERMHGNTWTCACEHGNTSMGTWGHLHRICTDFHIHLLNTHRVHLFLALHIILTILIWCWIYNTLYWTSQQTLKIICSLPLKTSRIHHVNDNYLQLAFKVLKITKITPTNLERPCWSPMNQPPKIFYC